MRYLILFVFLLAGCAATAPTTSTSPNLTGALSDIVGSSGIRNYYVTVDSDNDPNNGFVTRQIVNAGTSSSYGINVTPGSYNLYAWRDNNQNGTLDAGDSYSTFSQGITFGGSLNYDLTLNLLL